MTLEDNTVFFDRYKVRRKLGEGHYSDIFLVEDLNNNNTEREPRLVVLKVMRHSDSKASVSHLERELRALRALSDHLSIPALYDFHVAHFEDKDSRSFAVLEYVEGQSLLELLEHVWQGPMPVPVILRVIRRAALALDHIHKAGIIHGDLSLGNLIVNKAGTIKLIDYGLARFKSVFMFTRSLTPVAGAGTPMYMAPEAFEEKGVTERSDLYSLGLIMYHLLLGHAPFNLVGKNLLQMAAVIAKGPPELPKNNPTLTKSIRELYQSLTEMQADQRIASGRAVAKFISDRFGTESLTLIPLQKLPIGQIHNFWFKFGQRCLVEGRKTEALEIIHKLTTKDFDHASADHKARTQYLESIVKIKTGEFHDADEKLKKARELAPNNINYVFQHALLAGMLGCWNESQLLFTTVIAAEEDYESEDDSLELLKVRSCYHRSQVYWESAPGSSRMRMAEESREEALARADDIVGQLQFQKYGKNAEINVSNHLSKALCWRGRIKLFELISKNALEVVQAKHTNTKANPPTMQPDDRMNNFRKIVLGAIEDFDLAIELNQENSMAYALKGYALSHLKGETEQSLECLSTGLRLDPTNTEALLWRARALRAENSYHEALEDLNQLLTIRQKRPSALYQRGSIYLTLKDFKKAINDFNHAIENGFGTRPQIYHKKSKAHEALNQHAEAQLCLKKAERLSTDRKESATTSYVDLRV